jgi:hypothetical protein
VSGVVIDGAGAVVGFRGAVVVVVVDTDVGAGSAGPRTASN